MPCWQLTKLGHELFPASKARKANVQGTDTKGTSTLVLFGFSNLRPLSCGQSAPLPPRPGVRCPQGPRLGTLCQWAGALPAGPNLSSPPTQCLFPPPLGCCAYPTEAAELPVEGSTKAGKVTIRAQPITKAKPRLCRPAVPPPNHQSVLHSALPATGDSCRTGLLGAPARIPSSSAIAIEIEYKS